MVCSGELPEMAIVNPKDSPIVDLFKGRLSVEEGFSLYHYHKSSVIQKVLHHIKYNGGQELGHQLGLKMGKRLKRVSGRYDVIVPVPATLKKMKLRGYNQAAVIARGISEVMGLPLETEGLFRKEQRSSQTTKGRYDRWVNASADFGLLKPLDQRHVLLVDDVVTSGATLAGCAVPLLEYADMKISIATLACA